MYGTQTISFVPRRQHSVVYGPWCGHESLTVAAAVGTCRRWMNMSGWWAKAVRFEVMWDRSLGVKERNRMRR